VKLCNNLIQDIIRAETKICVLTVECVVFGFLREYCWIVADSIAVEELKNRNDGDDEPLAEDKSVRLLQQNFDFFGTGNSLEQKIGSFMQSVEAVQNKYRLNMVDKVRAGAIRDLANGVSRFAAAIKFTGLQDQDGNYHTNS
jgi:hypothetical protein